MVRTVFAARRHNDVRPVRCANKNTFTQHNGFKFKRLSNCKI